ncbi:MAG: DnaD domain protein [Eubacteriales bacterium]|nr:DnaD domain protein [Eubacteriales bacterium]
MSSFTADPASILWDATAVSNAFLCEYMPSAPDGYVKVYLYGLMYAHGGMGEEDSLLDDVSKALSMDRSEVEQALRYWERRRLLTRVKDNPPVYRFASVQQTMFMKQSGPKDEAYERFAQALYDMFGDKRKLHGGDTVLAYEWVEQLKLPPDVVFMLIRHMISTRGIQFSFQEAQKVATDLNQQQVNTADAAEVIFSRSEAAWKGTRKLLNHMGKRRNPTVDEIDLYLKWTTQWDFAPKAIEVACAEMTRGDPSFAYLDKILLGVRDRSQGKATTAAQMKKHLSEGQDETARIRAVLAAIGMTVQTVDEGKRAVYRGMASVSNAEVILLAANQAGKKKGAGLDDVVALVDSWSERGLKDAASVSAYLQSVQATDKRLRALFTLAGKEPGCTQANRELLRKWREDWQFSDPLLDLAAAYARNVERPMPYMDKLLHGWHEKSVTTITEAQEEHERFTDSARKEHTAARGTKKVIEQQYSQRDYDPDEVNGPSAEDIEEAMKL